MRITSELLEKYYAGRCNKEETEAIKRWLESPLAETVLPSYEKLDLIEKEIWSEIDPKKNDNIKAMPQWLNKYIAAACLAAAIFAGGYLIGIWQSYHNENIIADNDPKSEIHISAHSGKISKLEGDRFDISFQGTLQIYNASNSITEITCGDEKFILQPMQMYFLDGSHQAPACIAEKNIVHGFSHRLNGFFKVSNIGDKG